MSKITKLGLGIVCFDGSEHIKNICSEIRNDIDYILVCLQKISYHGEPIDEYDVKEVENLKNIGLIDEILWYEPDLSYKSFNENDFITFKSNYNNKIKNDSNIEESLKKIIIEREDKLTNVDILNRMPRILETEKRNMMIDRLQEVGCSHDIIIDSDEFYDNAQLKKAKEVFNNDDNMEVTYCQYVNYYRDYRHYMLWPWDSYVPFIASIRFRFLYEYGSFNKASDPTRRYYIPYNDNCQKFHIFNWEVIHMHHLSWIRMEIEKKLESWSSKKYFENIVGLKNRILHRYYNYRDGENAVIMFNTPNYEVCVKKLPKQYIHPKYRLDEKVTLENKKW